MDDNLKKKRVNRNGWKGDPQNRNEDYKHQETGGRYAQKNNLPKIGNRTKGIRAFDCKHSTRYMQK